jgi:transcriptional regulator with XRE-family HTH domain
MVDPTQHGPTVRRRLLGQQLRALREGAGVTLAEAAEAIRGSTSKVSRLETGQSPFRQRDVADLLTCYGLTDVEERDAVLSAARQASVPGWWRTYGDTLPGWLATYVDLEDAAQLIRTYELQLVPGVLQTEEYARAVISRGLASSHPPEVIEERVRLRMSRQQLLTREGAPDVWVVIDEAVLRRVVGSAEVMRAQIEHLIDTAKTPNVTVQVLPFSAGLHSADGGAFTLLRFAEPELPDVVYVERLISGVLLDRRDEVDRYTAVMNQLSVESASPDDTVDILTGLLEEVR